MSAEWYESSRSLSLTLWLQAPIGLLMDYRVLDDYARLVLNDPYWDEIPF